ncbi:hypothetical protein [Frigidibacter sp. MR17.24]|uniref:hypothetical protein n=1 Tax=Frigidibacter sp. MR17.24 TaxID=3127345 RepID=UPI003012CDDE
MTTQRRFLVLARTGDKSLHERWLDDDGPGRSWDLQLNSYARDPSKAADQDLPTVFDHGTKWDSIVRHFRADPGLLERYDYVMLPDDDVLMTTAGIDRLFAIAVEHALVMAQPALTLESYISYPILLQTPGFVLRYSTFLESMACCIRSDYLRRLLPMFERHYTGWGTDLVWALLMESPAWRAAVVDAVPMTHTRPLYTGPLYSSYAEGISPQAEIQAFRGAFENFPEAMQVYGGVLANGRRVRSTEARLRNAVGLARIAGRSKLPKNGYRMALALAGRAVVTPHFRPKQLIARTGSEMAELGLGRRPTQP